MIRGIRVVAQIHRRRLHGAINEAVFSLLCLLVHACRGAKATRRGKGRKLSVIRGHTLHRAGGSCCSARTACSGSRTGSRVGHGRGPRGILVKVVLSKRVLCVEQRVVACTRARCDGTASSRSGQGGHVLRRHKGDTIPDAIHRLMCVYVACVDDGERA